VSTTTCIRGAAWAAVWDTASGRHVYRRGVDVVFTGGVIGHVGAGYAGTADVTVDGRELFVLPGLVNLHSHPSTEPGYRGIREDHGVPGMYMSGLYERVVAFRLDEEGRRAAAEVAFDEMLRSGVTSVVDLSSPYPGWLDLLARSGLRGFVAPGYASARWTLEGHARPGYRWDEAAGRRGFEAAQRIIGEADRHPCGRLSGVYYPAQIDTCSEELLRESAAAARAGGHALTIHAAQSVPEFQVMLERHGRTPVQWAQEIGLLGPSTILGHAIYIDEHPWLHWGTREDLGLLAASGTAVAHCPTPFARYGQILHSLGRYLRAGVRVGIGTDVSPHNLIEEMRWSAVLGRIAGEDVRAVSTADILHAATASGADALGRTDLGRLAPGARADLVLVDLAAPSMRPVRDPLRSLVYSAADRAVRDVYVDGAQVVRGGRVLTLDAADAHGRLQEAQERMLAAVPRNDPRGRDAAAIAPLSMPLAAAVTSEGRI
jgi:5-methylthioadenosine/S-adenosylhomocysteine deaminase